MTSANFGNFAKSPLLATGIFNPVQSDTVDEADIVQGLHCLASGTVKVLTVDGQEISIIIPATGFVVPFIIQCAIKRVFDTGTTLTNAQMIYYSTNSIGTTTTSTTTTEA